MFVIIRGLVPCLAKGLARAPDPTGHERGQICRIFHHSSQFFHHHHQYEAIN